MILQIDLTLTRYSSPVSPRFFPLFRSLYFSLALHYLNAWNRLKVQLTSTALACALKGKENGDSRAQSVRLKNDLCSICAHVSAHRPPPPPHSPKKNPQASNARDPLNCWSARPLGNKVPFTTFSIATRCCLLFEEAIAGLSSLASIAGLVFRTWPRFQLISVHSLKQTKENSQSRVTPYIYISRMQ